MQVQLNFLIQIGLVKRNYNRETAMRKSILSYIAGGLVALPLAFVSCTFEENIPDQLAEGNEINVAVVASESVVDTKTTFEGEKLVWCGNETMGVLIANTRTISHDKSTSSTLVIDPATYTFSGEVNLGSFMESDIRAVTVPSNPDAWVRYYSDMGSYSLNIPIAANQIQYADGVMNGDNFPLAAFITDEIRSAARQPDGSYRFTGVQLQWECAAIRFNIYGNHPDMKYDERLRSVSVKFNDSSETTVTLDAEAYAFGKTKAKGIKIFMAIAPQSRGINKVTVCTDKAEYTLEGDGKSLQVISGVNLRGNVYQLGLNFSKFSREELPEEVLEPFTAIGKLTYEDGTPASGVSVSDGYNVAVTDYKGTYRLKTCADTYYIYYSVPEDCEVQVNEYGQPAFFTRYSQSESRYDFTLKRKAGGKEDKFTLFCLADPQCKSEHLKRFANETVTDLKAHAMTKNGPVYGVTLGDVVYSEGNRDNVPEMDDMRDLMHKDKTGMPIFQVMGNHDYTYFKGDMPLEPDETSSTYNIKAQRAFEEIFGPIDYSWNRGDVHFVCMRNMQWYSNSSASEYTARFTDQQYQWLKQDLAAVPKNKMVILCVHIPVSNMSKEYVSHNVQNVLDLLKQFKEAHIMSGHTHYSRNEPTLHDGIYEHVHAAVSGCWWYSKVNGDGSPNGYGVYEIDGNTITNWYYKGVNEGMNSRDYQLRLYRGDILGGGRYEKFAVPYGDQVILANVFNADPDWKIKVYENGVYSGDMTLIPHVAKADDTPAFVDADTPSVPSVNTSRDWWAIGYHVGFVGRGHKSGKRSSYITACYHMYKYTLKDKNAEIRVEATDRFGRTYVATEFTDDYDYSLMN